VRTARRDPLTIARAKSARGTTVPHPSGKVSHVADVGPCAGVNEGLLGRVGQIRVFRVAFRLNGPSNAQLSYFWPSTWRRSSPISSARRSALSAPT
jgi:hypothetical protein